MRRGYGIAGLVVLTLSPVAVRAQVARDTKVVFLKGTTLMTATADGSNVQTLVNDGVYKTNPHWSPGGDKIVYDTPSSTDPLQAADTLVVVNTNGQALNTITQDTGADWTFSTISEVGWYNEAAVYVTGSVNHFIENYVSLDLNSGRAIQNIEEPTGVDPPGFRTCPANSEVAYPVDERSAQVWSVSVQINGSMVYNAQLPARPTSYQHADLLWSEDCSRLSFTERMNPSAPDTFVVLSGTTVEARIAIPASVQYPEQVKPVGSSFVLLNGPPGQYIAGLLYDVTSHTLQAAPPTLIQQLNQREAAEQKLMQMLGGQSPDWYRSSQ